MSNDINLFQHTSSSITQNLSKEIRWIRIVALLFLFIVPTGAVLLFLFIFFSPQTALQQQESEMLTKVSTLGKKVSAVSFINDRILNSKQFISKRSIYGKALGEITLQLPTEVVLNTLNIQNNNVSISVSSSSLTALQTYQTSLLTVPKSTQILQKIAFQTITFIPGSANYQMALTATIHE
jgi:Tfp pilus assembly protein PilN